jgi:hypothetical protein
MIPAFLVNLDFSKNQLLNPAFQVLATEPNSPVLGQFFYNSTNSKFGYYNGTIWVYGSQLTFANGGAINWTIAGDSVTLNIANTTQSVAGFMSTVDKIKLDAATASNTNNTIVIRDGSGGIAVSNISTTTGTIGTNAVNGTDIVNLNTLLNYLNTGTKYKQPVRIAVPTNVSTLSGLQTLEGVTLVANDRVLLYGQTTASQNGFYVAASGVWTRTTDLPTGSNASGVHVVVMEGTLNADNIYICTTDNAVGIVGTNVLAFNRLPSSIQVDNVTIELAAGVLQVKDLGISTAKLANLAVTTAKIADSNITTAKIADSNITSAKIATSAADQSTITGGGGTAFTVANYTPISGSTIQRVRVVTGVTIGAGTPINVTHNFNTLNIADVSVRDSSTGQNYYLDWIANAVNTVSLTANGANKTVIVTVTA